MLDCIRVVLVETSHPANIGSVARAMKTMGLSDLVLVRPHDFPSARATWLASGAIDVLQRAKVVDTLEEAISNCQLVLGASARARRIPWPVMNAREGGEVGVNFAAMGQSVALVFGRESKGLTNEELQMCQYHVYISGNPEYSVLNIASAVQVICYEVRMAYLARQSREEKEEQGDEFSVRMPMSTAPWDEPLSTHAEMQGFYQHLTQTLEALEFYDPKHPRQLLTRLSRIFQRTRLDKVELNILRGILTSVTKLLERMKSQEQQLQEKS